MPPRFHLSRHLALTLLYVGGGLSVATAATQVWLSPLSTPAKVAFNAVEALGLLACIPAIVILAHRAARAREPVNTEPGWDSLHAAQQRLTLYAQEAAAHAFAVPFILITTGILVLIVTTRVLTRSTYDDYQTLVFGLGFLAMTLGGLLPFLALQREARRLRDIQQPRTDPD